MKPGFFKNEELADCGPVAQLLFAGLWTLADRRGRLEDRPRRIKAELFPFYDADVDVMLTQLSQNGFITRYEHGGEKYIQINNFERHQNPHVKESESTIPAPGLNGAGTGNTGTSHADSLLPLTDSLNPILGAPRPKFAKPSLEEVTAYCKERGNNVSPNRFLNHYESNGWRVGKNPMKDWKAAVRTWEQNEHPGGNNATRQQVDNSAIGQVRAANKRARDAQRRADAAGVGENDHDVRAPLEVKLRD